MSGAEGVGRVLEGALGGYKAKQKTELGGGSTTGAGRPFRDIFCGPRYETQLA